MKQGVSAAALAAAAIGMGSWLGCNELFSIEEPVHEVPDGGGMEAGPPQEDCLDGIDNDGDGKIDCEDVDCLAGYSCVEAPAAGFSPPLYVQQLPYPAAQPPPPCPDGMSPAVYYADPSPAMCDACTCDWQGAACSAPTMQMYIHGGCGTPLNPITTNDTKCIDYSTPDVGTSAEITAGPKLLNKGTCTPSGGTPTPQAPVGKEVRVCAAKTGSGCDAGKVCVKDAPPMFENAVCMSQGGNVPCPAHWTDPTLDVFGSYMDKRACSACGCDLGAVSCSGGKYKVDSGFGCKPAGATKDVGTPNVCEDLSNIAFQGGFTISMEPTLGQAQGMKCGTAMPSGMVETTGEATICCHQMN